MWGHGVDVVHHPVLLGQRASQVAGDVVGQRAVGTSDQHGPEVVVAAVAVDRHDRVHLLEEGIQLFGDPGDELGRGQVPAGAVGLDQRVER